MGNEVTQWPLVLTATRTEVCSARYSVEWEGTRPKEWIHLPPLSAPRMATSGGGEGLGTGECPWPGLF